MSNSTALPRRSLFKPAQKLSTDDELPKKEAVFTDENLGSAQKIGIVGLPKNCACIDEMVSNTAALWHEHQR